MQDSGQTIVKILIGQRIPVDATLQNSKLLTVAALFPSSSRSLVVLSDAVASLSGLRTVFGILRRIEPDASSSETIVHHNFRPIPTNILAAKYTVRNNDPKR